MLHAVCRFLFFVATFLGTWFIAAFCLPIVILSFLVIVVYFWMGSQTALLRCLHGCYYLSFAYTTLTANVFYPLKFIFNTNLGPRYNVVFLWRPNYI